MGERYKELSALVRGVRYRWRAMAAMTTCASWCATP